MFLLGILVGAGLVGLMEIGIRKLTPKPVPVKTTKKKG